MALLKHEGGERKTEEGRWPIGMSREGRKEHRMSIANLIMNTKYQGKKKNLLQKIPKG